MGRGASDNSTHDLLNKLITQLGNLGINISSTGNGSNATVSPSIGPTTTPSRPIAYYASPSPVGPAVPAFYCSARPLLALTTQTGPTHYASPTVGYSVMGQAQTPQPSSTTATHNQDRPLCYHMLLLSGLFRIHLPVLGTWTQVPALT
ncbi:hypothetical protein Tco_0031663 [Tanacetum coccineum]